jgi:hypothetical protein
MGVSGGAGRASGNCKGKAGAGEARPRRFKHSLVKAMLLAQWKKKSQKPMPMTSTSVTYLGELMHLLVKEAVSRAEFEAQVAGDDQVEPEHVENIAITLMSDF